MRMRSVRCLPKVVAATMASVVFAGPALASSTITEYPTPSDSGPAAIVLGPDGAMWFAEQTSGSIARIDPVTKAITEYDLPTNNSNPEGITTGPDNNIWFTEANANKIGRRTMAGVFSEFDIPGKANNGGSSSPHSIVAGPDGALWFAEQEGNRIGRITVDGSITESAPLPASYGTPHIIAAGPDGNLWFSEWVGPTASGGPGGSAIGRINPSSMLITEFPLPDFHNGGPAISRRPHGISAGPDGRMWWGENASDDLGRLDPVGTDSQIAQSIAEFHVPDNGITGSLVVNNTGSGPDGKIWFTELLGNAVGRVTPDGANIDQFALPTGAPGRASNGPASIVAGPDAAMWFTEHYTDKVGRIQL